MLSPQTKFNGTFVNTTTPLKEEDEDSAITVWIYREKNLVDLIEQSHEITSKKYDLGLKIMK